MESVIHPQDKPGEQDMLFLSWIFFSAINVHKKQARAGNKMRPKCEVWIGNGRTDGQTYGRTDGRTYGRTHPLIEMLGRI